MRKLSKPIIAKAHGVATAVGGQLMATCNVGVALTEAALRRAGGVVLVLNENI